MLLSFQSLLNFKKTLAGLKRTSTPNVKIAKKKTHKQTGSLLYTYNKLNNLRECRILSCITCRVHLNELILKYGPLCHI